MRHLLRKRDPAAAVETMRLNSILSVETKEPRSESASLNNAAAGPLKRQHGLALIEVMIAMFLFAISIVGYSQLQMRSIHESYDGQQRAVALRIASGLIDRMSANTTALDTYSAAIAGFGECPANPVASCAETDAAAPACTDDQLANYDVWYSFCGQESGVADSLTDFEPSITCAGGTCQTGVDMLLRLQWVSKVADSNANINAAQVNDQVMLRVRL